MIQTIAFPKKSVSSNDKTFLSIRRNVDLTLTSDFCGGFIINHRWVGCAAHCTINRNPLNMMVVIGAHNRITGGTQMSVSAVINHEQYSSATLPNDISVVQTTNTIVCTANVKFIPLSATLVSSGAAQVNFYFSRLFLY